MPKATIEGLVPERYPLKSLPATDTDEEGFVTIRRMPYGLWLTRQELALKLEIQSGKGKDTAGELAMANKSVTVFEFKNCIIDHNLENEAGDKLDFKKDFTLDLLDPKIGNEIGDIINELHKPATDESLGN